MKKIQFLIWLFSILLYQNILYCFDVKVLLQKYQIAEKPTIHLYAQHGFIISSDPELSIGYHHKNHDLNITACNGLFMLDQKQTVQKKIIIYPALSNAVNCQLQEYVNAWFDQNVQELDLNNKDDLQRLFSMMVSNQVVTDSQYDCLVVAIEQIIYEFLRDFLAAINQTPVIGLEKLEQYVQDLYDSSMKIQFLELVGQEQLSKQERKAIEKNKQQRYDFFESKLYQTARVIMQKFLPVLPAKLIHQFLQDEVSTIGFEHHKYSGSIILYQDKQQLLLINNLDIDDYLISVIRHEGWPGWPLEMNKVLAIVCRTYLIWQVLQAQKLNRAYHIENGIKHQTYKGHHVDLKMKQAIAQTRDMFIAFDGKPALTMYDACCGGIIPAHIDDPAHKNITYLARTYPCTFCKNFKIFHWHKHFSEHEVAQRLKTEFGKINKVVDIAVSKRDRAGLVKKITFNVGSRKIVITEKKMKSLFPEIKSMCFSVSTHSGSSKKFEISGRGYGHHKGLCQWGACKLVKDDHWNFEQVLQFYYPGTTLMKLVYQR